MILTKTEIDLKGSNPSSRQGEIRWSSILLKEVKDLNLQYFCGWISANRECFSCLYEHFLRQSVAVKITYNKYLCSSAFDNYKKLKHLSRRYK
jgi:aspartokinase/homoserine dehydrogenase 1